MANRTGVFICAYVPRELKEVLKRNAKNNTRTLTQEVIHLLSSSLEIESQKNQLTVPERRKTSSK